MGSLNKSVFGSTDRDQRIGDQRDKFGSTEFRREATSKCAARTTCDILAGSLPLIKKFGINTQSENDSPNPTEQSEYDNTCSVVFVG
jgi:hypothetical protein